jgi:hypothetical protein
MRQNHLRMFLGTLLAAAALPAQSHLFTEYGIQGEMLGQTVCGLGDVDGDGVGDFLAGTPNPTGPGRGRVVVYSGRTGVSLYTLTGPATGDGFGRAARAVGDLDGDGASDFVVGMPWDATSGSEAGAARVFSGASGALLFTLTGKSAGDHFGWSVCGPGDTNRDGTPDIVVGAPDANGGFGGVYVHSGTDGARLREIVATTADLSFGFSLSELGDIDDDGAADFVIGCPGGRTPIDHDLTGWAEVVSGIDGTPLITYYGTALNASAGYSVASAGDVNGDGKPDVIVGMPGLSPSGTFSGAALVYSAVAPQYLYSFPGGKALDRLGWLVAGVGDVNADGTPDILISKGANNGSQAYIRSGADGALLFEVPRRIGDLNQYLDARGVGDINGDGHADFVCGVSNAYNFSGGAAHVFSGTVMSLSSDVHGARVRTTDQQKLSLEAGAAHAGKIYLMLGTVSGTSPGLPLGGIHIPLNYDFYFDLLARLPNTIVTGSLGVLDTEGKATATFRMINAIPLAWAGTVMHHAYIVVPADLSGFDFASNAVPLTLLPRF